MDENFEEKVNALKEHHKSRKSSNFNLYLCTSIAVVCGIAAFSYSFDSFWVKGGLMLLAILVFWVLTFKYFMNN